VFITSKMMCKLICSSTFITWSTLHWRIHEESSLGVLGRIIKNASWGKE
jgi:hypothetical protein